MTRRRFIHNLFQGFKATLALNMAVSCARPEDPTSQSASNEEQPYIPLNGRNLKELSRQKIHHGSERFLNPFSSVPKGRFGRVLQWKLFSDNPFKKYYTEEPSNPIDMDWRAWSALPGLSVTLIKHACLYIQDNGFKMLLDPVFSNMFWGIKDFTPLKFSAENMPRPDLILITHGHYDHLSTDTLAGFPTSTQVISPLGYDEEFRDLGFNRRLQLDWFETVRVNGAEITLLPCNHWTMRNPLIGPNTSLWGSYLIRTRSGATLYLSGDTGYFDGFEQIGDLYDIDLAVFNLGAYEPRWFMASSHVNPPETVRAFNELKARHLMIAHWGTYRLGDEPVHFPPIQLAREMKQAGLKSKLFSVRHGEALHYTAAAKPVIDFAPSG